MVIDYQEFGKVFKQIWEAFRKVAESIKWIFDNSEDIFKCYLKKKKLIENTRASWYVPADTRMKSQVILNRPKNLVRKVIR